MRLIAIILFAIAEIASPYNIRHALPHDVAVTPDRLKYNASMPLEWRWWWPWPWYLPPFVKVAGFIEMKEGVDGAEGVTY